MYPWGVGLNRQRSDLTLFQRMQDNDWNRSVMLSEFLRFNAFGFFNSVFAWVLYELLYRLELWPGHAAVAAWGVSCAIGMIESHYVHYKFTFDSTFPYGRSLYRAIVVYAGQLLVTTTVTFVLVEKYFIHHRLVWLLNTCLFGVLNFLLIRWIAFPPEHDVARAASLGSFERPDR